METKTSANQKNLTSSGNYSGAGRRVQYLESQCYPPYQQVNKVKCVGYQWTRRKAFEKIHHLLTLKTQQTRNRGDLFQFHKHHLQKGLANVLLCSDVSFTTLVNTVLEVLTAVIKQEK